MADLVSAVRLSTRPLPTSRPGLTRFSALRVRAPDSCHVVARLLDDAAFAPSLPRCLSSLAGAVQPPAFADLPPHPPVGPADPDEPVDTTRGWQRPAFRAIDNSTAGRFHSADPLLRRVLTALPSCHELTLDSPVLRALLLRRLRLPFPARRCSPCKLVAAAAPSTLSATTTLLAPVLPSCAPVASRACCCPDLPRSRGYSCLQCSGARPQHLNIHPERLDDRRIEVHRKMDSRSGAERDLLSTPPSCPLSMPVELRAGTSGSTVAPIFALHAGLKNAPIPSCCARRRAGLLSSRLRLVNAGVPRLPSSFASSLGAGPRAGASTVAAGNHSCLHFSLVCLARLLCRQKPSVPVSLVLSLPGTANVDGI